MLLRYAPRGCVNEVVTQDDPAAPFLRDQPCPVHALGSARTSWYCARLVPWLRANRSRFDGVIVHGLWEYSAIAVLRAVAGHTPYIVFVHGMLDPYFKRSFPLKHLKKWAFWVTVQYWALRRARRVLFTTAAERDLATQSFWLHRWNAMVVGLGAETPPESLADCASAFHQSCPALYGKRYLLFLGRIDPKKGCDLLVQAFAATRSSDPDLHLVIAGPDSSSWRAELEAAAAEASVAERVHWPGMLTGAVKWGAFAACEAFILPSHQENFGIAIAEALACGKPVLITTPINISTDLAADGCALVEDDTLDGTRRLIGRWLALTGEQRAKMRERALVSFAARYEMRKSAAAVVEAFAPPLQPQARALAEAGRV